MDDTSVRNALLEIEEVVCSPAFNRWRTSFVYNNIYMFDYADENKLEYTSIHHEYEEEVERQILQGVKERISDFDMNAFQRALPDYLEGPGGRDEATGKAIQMLLEIGDFQQFKEMMMFTKKQREDQSESKGSEVDDMVGLAAESSQLAGLDVDGMMDMCAALSDAADEDSKWENVLKNDWMKIDKMAVPEARRKTKKDIYLKGVWTM